MMDDLELTQAELLDRYLTDLQIAPDAQQRGENGHDREDESFSELLSIAGDLRQTLSPPPLDLATHTQSKARVLRHVRAQVITAAPPQKRIRTGLQFGLALAGVALTALIAVSFSLGFAASDALPGDELYGVKRGVEQARLALTLTAEGDVDLLVRFADERLAEVEMLVALGREADLEAASEAYRDTIDQLVMRLDSMASQTESASLETALRRLERHAQALDEISGQLSDAAQTTIDRAIERSNEGKEAIEERMPPRDMPRQMIDPDAESAGPQEPAAEPEPEAETAPEAEEPSQGAPGEPQQSAPGGGSPPEPPGGAGDDSAPEEEPEAPSTPPPFRQPASQTI